MTQLSKGAPLGGLEQRRARDRRRRRITTVVIGLVVVGGGALVYSATDDLTSPYATINATGGERDADAEPLGTPPQAPKGVGTFSFSAEQTTTDEPVAYDPCRTIDWAVHDELAPPGTDRLVEEAVEEVARATGLVFVRQEADEDADYHSVTALDGRSPVIIDWTTPRAVRGLIGSTAGIGGSAFLTDSTGERVYVTGAVALDTPQLRRLLARPAGAALVRTIVLHELGHVVGLDHVDDRNELMYREGTTRRHFGPGDLEGLAALGSGRCAGRLG